MCSNSDARSVTMRLGIDRPEIGNLLHVKNVLHGDGSAGSTWPESHGFDLKLLGRAKPFMTAGFGKNWPKPRLLTIPITSRV